MSTLEVQERVQELHSSLDPSAIAFLKRRGQIHNNNNTNTNIDPRTKSDGHGKVTRDEVTLDDGGLTAAVDDNDIAEKMHMAKLMSSIQNYDDMDAAYQVYQQQHMEDDTATSNSVEGGGVQPASKNVPLVEKDFNIACNLLRSTSPQQTLWACRVVCHRLQRDQRSGDVATSLRPLDKAQNNTWPYPTLLPVSLRCLLDANISHRSGVMLQVTYVLQSLYALLQLRVCADHVVDVSGSARSEAVCYQLDCLDDAVPTLSLKSCYAAAPAQSVGPTGDKDSPGVAYATSSSSTSALADGEAFLRDPMWTLLSRMRIIPRLSQLLREGSKFALSEPDGTAMHEPLLSVEALVAICGLLAMIGQRSPGAASAIVQHPTLMENLIALTLVRKVGSARYDPVPAVAAVILMCTLARQSRVAAENLSRRITASFFLVQELVSGRASNCADFRLQQWTVVLWRTFLRYGCCLNVLPIMLTLAAPHLTLRMGGDQELSPKMSSYSLAPDLFTSLASILNCIRALKRQARLDSETNSNAISEDQRSILSNAGIWLSSSKQQAIQHLKLKVESSLQNSENLRLLTSVLHYLHSLLVVTGEDDSDSPAGGFEVYDINLAEEESCIESLTTVVQSRFTAVIMNAALRFAFLPDFADVSTGTDAISVRFEACACAFFDALLTFVTDLQHRSGTSEVLRQKSKHLADGLGELIVSRLESNHTHTEDMSLSNTINSEFGTFRRQWLNRVHCSVVTFLNETKARPWNDVRKSRAIAFAVFGRLERGEESSAAILVSYSYLFQTEASARAHQTSPVSTLLMRELCRTPRSQHQLDHSFRLNNGLGITADGLGPFSLQSLLSEANELGSGDTDPSDYVLTIGKYWLWHLLSGSIVHLQTPNKSGGSEATDVLLSTLQIIEELESCEPTDSTTYAARLSVGPKLYFLGNICLHNESILSNDRIMNCADFLYDQYFYLFEPADVEVLAEQCRLHLDPRSVIYPDKSRAFNALTQEEQVQAILEPVDPTGTSLSHATMKSLETFAGDLCDAYLDYGAQYPFFTKCVRLYLVNGVPTKIRCFIVHRLRGALHLLTSENDGDVTILLRHFIAGGMPPLDNSARDPPELIDCILTMFSKGTLARPDDIFFVSWAIGLMAKSLAISLSMDSSSGISVSERRMQDLEKSFASRVANAASMFLSTEGSLDDLIAAALRDDADLPLTISAPQC